MIILSLVYAVSYDKNPFLGPDGENARSSSADYSVPLTFSGSSSSATGETYEVLPGPAVINPAMSPTPFSNRVDFGTGHGFLHLMFEDVSLSVK